MALALTFSLCAIGISKADDWFQINWSGTVYTVDANGKLVAKSYSAKNILALYAENYGLKASDLVLVYRPAAYDTAVVFKNAAAMSRAGLSSDAQVVGDYLQMPDITKVGTAYNQEVSANGQTARQAYLFDEHSDPIGTTAGVEKQKTDGSGNIVGESYHGTFHFAIPDDGSHSVAPAGIYMGTFSTGARVKDVRGQ